MNYHAIYFKTGYELESKEKVEGKLGSFSIIWGDVDHLSLEMSDELPFTLINLYCFSVQSVCDFLYNDQWAVFEELPIGQYIS